MRESNLSPDDRRQIERREEEDRRHNTPWVVDLNDPRTGDERRDGTDRRSGKDRRAKRRQAPIEKD